MITSSKLSFSTKATLVTVALLCAGQVYSQENTEFSLTKVITAADLATTDQELESFFNHLTPVEKAKARSWKLTNKEYSRYKKLMQTTGRDVWSPKIDPITLLGVESETDAQRNHYARLFNQVETERTKKELAFAFAQSSDLKKLNPKSNAFTPYLEQRKQRRISYHNQGSISQGSPASNIEWETTTYVAYVDLLVECKAKCKSLVQKVLKEDRVDFYFVGVEDDTSIYSFAKENAISSQRVKSGRITLNYGDKEKLPSILSAIRIQKLSGNDSAVDVTW